MQKSNLYYVIFIIVFLNFSCNNSKVNLEVVPSLTLEYDFAITLADLPLKCLQKEFPNKLNQSLSNSNEIGVPSVLHPAFYGCYDWHSSVHGHWLLVHLLRKFPNHPKSSEIISILTNNLTEENIQIEVDYFKRESEKSFERPYGWAWLLKLQQELDQWDHETALVLKDNLNPLTDFIVDKFIDFLPKLNYPVRSGEHSNTAFALSLAYDYALHFDQKELKELIENRSRYFYYDDKSCPIDWEPSGFDFLSPCLQEAQLMAKVLPANEFEVWFNVFLPTFSNLDVTLLPAAVSDRTDGKLVHLDGANFCRAWSLYSVVNQLPKYAHLKIIANQHIEYSLPVIVDGSYEGEHWLATFAALALANDE